MSTPTPESDVPREPSLVEPTRAQSPLPDLDSLDTGRILRETPVVPVPEGAETSMADATSATSSEAGDSRAGVNILSVVSLILALTLSPFAALFGYLAVGQIRRAGQKGEALAWTAIALGWLWLVGYAVAGTVLAIIWFELS